MAINGPQTLGTAMGAALIGIFDYRLLMIVMGVSVAACALPIAMAQVHTAREGAV